MGCAASAGSRHQDLVDLFVAWLEQGPERSSITFSRCDGSITAKAESHGSPEAVLRQQLAGA